MTMKRLKHFAACLLSKFSAADLDSIAFHARNLQHRKDDGWFRNKHGEWQQCRMEATEWDDPYMQQSGCAGEFANDFRKKDIKDGCPRCTGDVMDNASEPDVMSRWGF